MSGSGPAAALDTPTLRIVLDRGVGGEPPARRDEILLALLDAGHAVACPAADGDLARTGGGPALVLRDGGGDPGSNGDGTDAVVRDISGMEVDAVLELVESVRNAAAASRPGEWKPWFPVIDFGRCTNCMQCLSFCLFDVYGVDAAQRIEVRNNDKCKTNCPACSRVCPEVAILFPKYGSGPINGDEVSTADVEREKMKTDISALLGGDIYSMLRERHQRAESRFAKERDESRALKERLKCLKKLGADLDIPEEVLMALPSIEEIRERAERASRDNGGGADRDRSPDPGSGGE